MLEPRADLQCAVLPGMMNLPDCKDASRGIMLTLTDGEAASGPEPPADPDRPWSHCACHATAAEVEERLKEAAAAEVDSARRADHEKVLKEQWEHGNVRGE